MDLNNVMQGFLLLPLFDWACEVGGVSSCEFSCKWRWTKSNCLNVVIFWFFFLYGFRYTPHTSLHWLLKCCTPTAYYPNSIGSRVTSNQLTRSFCTHIVDIMHFQFARKICSFVVLGWELHVINVAILWWIKRENYVFLQSDNNIENWIRSMVVWKRLCGV